MHVFLIVLLFQYVIAKNVTFTTDVVDGEYINGAKITNLAPTTVEISNNKWDVVVGQDTDEWGLWINMDTTWGYHSTLPSQLIMTISGNSVSINDCDMLLSITDGLDSQTSSRYFTMVVRLDNKGVNFMGPACDTNLQTPTKKLFTGDVYYVMAATPPPGNRACRPAYINTSLPCEYDQMGPPSTASNWPFTFTINNYPSENRMTVTFEGNGYTATNCGFMENIPLNAGHNIYITGQSADDNFEISSIYLQYKLLATTTAEPSTTPTTNIPTKTPTLNPTNTPTTNNPTNTPTKTPTITPTNYPITTEPTTSIPTTNQPSIHPTTSIPTTTQPTPIIPTTAIPTTATPTTYNPTTAIPTTAMPSTVIPTTNNPTTTIPTTNIPTTIQPTFQPTISPITMQPSTSNPTGIPTTMQPTFQPSISPSSKSTATPTRKPTNEGEHVESTFIGTHDDDRLEVSGDNTLGVTSILMITIITVLILILLCCIIICIKKLKYFFKLKQEYGDDTSKLIIVHYGNNNINNMQYNNDINGNGEGGSHRISIVNARPEGGSHTIPLNKNEPGLEDENEHKDDDEDVMDGIEETQIITPGNGLPKPPPRQLSPKKIINDAFIDAIVYQAQPPQIELNEVKKQQRYKNNNENESEPLMDENENENDDNDIEYYNGDMIIKGDNDTIGDIEKKLNEEDDYDEGKSTYRSMKNVAINENEEMDINVKDMKNKMDKYKKKYGKKESDSESYIINGSESETKK